MTAPLQDRPSRSLSDGAPGDEYGLTPEITQAVIDSLHAGDIPAVERIVEEVLYPADVADLIEQLGYEDRRLFVTAMRQKLDPEVFPELNETIRDEVLALIGAEALAGAVQELDSDDALEIIADLDEEQQRDLLARLPLADRLVLEQGLNYREYTAGRLMQRDLVAVPAFWTVGETIDYMRGSPNLPDDFYDIFVVDPRHRPVGTVPLSRILRNRRPVHVGDIMDSDVTPISVDMAQEELAFVFRQQDLVSAPVVDENGRLLGVVTIDDVVDVIDEEAEDDLMKLGGVQGGDFYQAAFTTARSRSTWLLVNLFTALLTASVISLFEATIQEIVALAILMPIVASMGGNAGTQALTVAVRALATRELTTTNAMRTILKEVVVGSMNGMVFAVLIGLIAGLWFQNVQIGGVIATAMILNLAVAGFCGVSIPLALDRLGVDPAIASAVFLTTVTDVIGFFAFLGLATLVLL